LSFSLFISTHETFFLSTSCNLNTVKQNCQDKRKVTDTKKTQ
jgi:hypothetical protein